MSDGCDPHADREKGGRGILVTGTDTGVGKTRVACLLGRRLREAGVRAVPLKPVESGCGLGPDGRPFPADAALLRDAFDPALPLGQVCMHAFAEPVSPHLAARAAGVVVEPGRIREAVARAADSSGLVVVEGAGGVAVELAEGYSFADLARDAGLTVLVVAENRLGVLNHLRLTLAYLRSQGCPVCGVVLNDRTAEPFPARESNEEEARRVAGDAFLGRIPAGAAVLPEAVFRRFREIALP